MKSIAASIVILSAAIIFASGIVSHAGNSDGGLISGIVVGIIGFALLFGSWKEPRNPSG